MISDIKINLLEQLLDPSAKPVCAGPLAGWTDSPYRAVLRNCGCDHMWIPFVSSHAVASRKSPNRDKYVSEVRDEKGHVQIFGASPMILGQAAAIIEDAGAKTIDFNCGCSVRKVHKGGGGSALLKDLDLLKNCLKSIIDSVSIPVTLKTRIGFFTLDDKSGIEACKIAQDLGCAWVTLHGRTAKQAFGGVANRDAIAGLVDELKIPVIGNGDVSTPGDAKRMFDETNCAGVMIGRGLVGDPWIIADTEEFLKNGASRPDRPRSIIVDIMLEHQRNLLEHWGDDLRGVWEFRKHVSKYLRGFAQASIMRNAIVRMDNPADVTSTLKKFGDGRPPLEISKDLGLS